VRHHLKASFHIHTDFYSPTLEIETKVEEFQVNETPDSAEGHAIYEGVENNNYPIGAFGA